MLGARGGRKADNTDMDAPGPSPAVSAGSPEPCAAGWQERWTYTRIPIIAPSFPRRGAPGCHHRLGSLTATKRGSVWENHRGRSGPRVLLARLSPSLLLDPYGIRYVPTKVVDESTRRRTLLDQQVESPASWHFRVDPLGPEAAVVTPGPAQAATSLVLSTHTFNAHQGPIYTDPI